MCIRDSVVPALHTFRLRDGQRKVIASIRHPAEQTALLMHLVDTYQGTPDNLRLRGRERGLDVGGVPGPVPLRCAAGPDRARSAAPRARQTAAPRTDHRPGPGGPPRPPAHRPARPRPGRRSADHRLRPAPRAAWPRRLTLLPDPDTPPARPRPGRRQPANRYPSTCLLYTSD